MDRFVGSSVGMSGEWSEGTSGDSFADMSVGMFAEWSEGMWRAVPSAWSGQAALSVWSGRSELAWSASVGFARVSGRRTGTVKAQNYEAER